MKVATRAAVMLLFVLAAAPAVAQTTGQIEGTVTDPSGAIVAGALVTAASPSLIGKQQVTTDGRGQYYFFNLPPGRYIVTAEAGGFQMRETRDVVVSLDRTTTLDVELVVAQLGESVTVTTSDAAPIDVTSSEVNTVVTAELFTRLPTTRTLQSIISIAPSVVGSGLRDDNGRERAPSVAGSSGPENNYVLDGVSTTDPATGLEGSNIAFDFLQEVQVKTGAFAAEYGQSTGGIVNAITKSGGDELHGDLFVYFNPSSFVAGVKDSALSVSSSVPNGYNEKDFGGDLGGPLVKDTLWFFAAVNPQFRTNYHLSQSFLLPFEQNIRTPFYAGKLTWQPHEDHRLTASTFADHTTLEGGNPGATGFSTDLGYLQVRQRTGGSNYAFKYDVSITDRFILGAVLGLHYQRSNRDALDLARAQLPFRVDREAVDPITGRFRRDLVLPGSGPGFLESQRRNRWEWSLAGTNLFSGGAFGGHAIKYGYAYQDSHYDTYGALSGGYLINNRYANANPGDINHPDLHFFRSARISEQIDADTHTTIHSFFIQDAWRLLGNLSLNLGVRWEMPRVAGDAAQAERFSNTNATPGRDYYFKFTKLWENAAPRLGFAYDFTGEGKGKIYGNVARFFESAIPLDLNALAATGFAIDVAVFTGPNASGDLVRHERTAPTPTPVDPDLKPQYVDEATAGIDYEVMPDLAIGGRFVWRNVGRVIEDGILVSGDSSTYFIMNPGESLTGRAPFVGDVTFFTGLDPGSLTTIPRASLTFPKPIRRYRAVEVTATKRYAGHSTFLASYTWSKLNGNYEGLFRNDNGQLNPNLTTAFELPQLLYNATGRLPNDRPHQFKFDGAYEWGFGLATGVSLRAQSGTPVSYFFSSLSQEFLLPRGAGGRTPAITRIDLHVAYSRRLGEQCRGSVILDVFNLMNQQKAITVDQSYRLNTGVFEVLELSPVNPLYGLGTFYQYPLAVRIGLKLHF
jgi:outer membrane receptor protein involved in Fe transport